AEHVRVHVGSDLGDRGFRAGMQVGVRAVDDRRILVLARHGNTFSRWLATCKLRVASHRDQGGRMSSRESGSGRGLRPPFVYFGGKQKLAATIAGLLPEHTHYVEPFAGSLAVLLAKTPTRLETVNDLDGDLILFWRVLRDRPEDLARVYALTPHSRVGLVTARQVPGDLGHVWRA